MKQKVVRGREARAEVREKVEVVGTGGWVA